MNRLLSVALIVFIQALFFNNAVNWHYHKLPNGIIVEHAHPFSKSKSTASSKAPYSPFEKHQHTEFEYLILDILYYGGLVLLFAFLSLSVFREFKNRVILSKLISFYGSIHSLLPPLRAPPVI